MSPGLSPDAKAIVRVAEQLTTQVRRIADYLTTPVVGEATTLLHSISTHSVQGFCPACGHGVLMLGDGGHVVCTLIDCPDPDAVDKLLTRTDDDATTPVHCPLCPITVPLSNPEQATAHFRAQHPEQRLVGPGPWPQLATGEDDDGMREAVAELIADHEGDEWASHPATTALRALFTGPPGPAATEATKPDWFAREMAAGAQRCDEAADMVRKAGTLRQQIYEAMKAKYLDNALNLGQRSPRQQIKALTDEALLVILPHGKFVGDQLRDSEATIERVITTVETGGPSSGAAVPSEWESGWDAAMDAVRNALNPTKEQ